MVPGDVGAEISRLLRAGVATGEWPAPAARMSAAGTWRPAPATISTGAGSYATALPLALARLSRRPAVAEAATLAAGLRSLPWISAARVTGDGYLTITVTTAHLAALPARIVAAGQAAADSDALAGRELTAPARPEPGAAASWRQAWQEQRDALTGHLARAAGAEVLFLDSQQNLAPSPPPQAGLDQVPVSVAGAVGYHGRDAVRYALARASAPREDRVIRQLRLPLDLDNPFVAVRYAHADAASALRWAADLGLAEDGEPAVAAAGQFLPPELALLDAMSWLPERVAAAARRRRPAELAAYLEFLGRMWLDCRESCPALPFQGHAAPAPENAGHRAARLGLADAARGALACGLGLLGIVAPARM
ncbi:MAG TPA: DALR anticodon-binding domain-containing protein [Streptosporangiaceae bacterium]|nr:DALR anticodon-binding domain-containing protein [Streptosporangiaceae bacterium]